MRAPGFVVLVLGLLSVSACPAASPSDLARPAQAAYAHGDYLVTLAVDAAQAESAGGIRCRVRAETGHDGVQVVAESAAANGGVNRARGCTLQVPLTWLRNQRDFQAILGFEMEIAPQAGNVRRTITRQGIAVDYPPEGGVAIIRVNLKY